MNDSELRELLRDSPDSGRRAVFDEYYNYVYAIVLRILRGHAGERDIEECVVDVFSDVLLHLDPERERTFKSYIGTVAKRDAISRLRNVRKQTLRNVPAESDELGELVCGDDIAADAENSIVTDLLMKAVAELGEPDSVIIVQKYFYDRKSDEIGRIVGMSPTAVRVRCMRAMKKLRKALDGLI